jgi:hypothetical protein
MAANEDGVWNPQEAELAFVISPTFAQTAWFKLLCVVTALVVLALLYRWRLRQVTRNCATRLEERADERERIARALHDTFLQSVQGLMLRMQTLLKRLPADGEARALVEKILDQSDQVLAEGRNQVNGLRNVQLYQNDLQRLFGELGQQLREQHAASFVLTVTGQPATLNPGEAGEHLYHIGREALLNAFRHASAGRIELELDLAPITSRCRCATTATASPSECWRQARGRPLGPDRHARARGQDGCGAGIMEPARHGHGGPGDGAARAVYDQQPQAGLRLAALREAA